MSTPSKDGSRGTSKMGFGQIKSGKQTAGGSFAIRFSASAMHDDDDLDILNDDDETKERYNRLQFEMTEPEEMEAHEEVNRCHSVSAPVSEVSTPIVEDAKIPASQPMSKSPSHTEAIAKEDIAGTPNTERSLLSGFRERFEGRLPDQLTAFIGRIEELSNDNSEEKKEKRLQKGDSLDEKKIRKSESFEYVKKFLEKRDSFMANKRGHSRNTSLDSNVSAGDCGEVNITSDKSDKSARSHNSSFEFLSPEDFQGNGVHEDKENNESNYSSSPDLQIVDKSKSRSMFKNLMPIKDKKGVVNSPSKEVTMTLSGLMSVDDIDEDVIEATEDVFFDPKDDCNQSNNSPPSEELQQASDQPTTKPDYVPSKKASLVFSNKNKLAAVLCIVLAYFVPLSPFVWGLIIGATFMWITTRILKMFSASSKPREPLVVPDMKTLPKLKVPEMKESKNKDNRFTGWMNELYQYSPEDYSINHTHSVYVQLEGAKLRLQRPKINVPRRAMWDDTIPATTFLHQRHFDIEGSRVFLMPSGLVKKRLWSKKYPICVALAKTGRQTDKSFALQASFDSESPSTYSAGQLPKSYSSDNLPRHKCKAKTLYLFARTSREKEDWYRRLEGAASGNPVPTSLTKLIKQWEARLKYQPPPTDLSAKSYIQQLPNESNSSTSSKAVGASTIPESAPQTSPPSNSDIPKLIGYLNYMGAIMPKEERSNVYVNSDKNYSNGIPREPDISVSCDPNVQWLNVVMGRLFWDFLKDDRWSRFMSEKLQKKMAKIHVPYFIDEFKVTEIEFGQRLPTIRRVSPPFLDERGLWVDMDVVYQGDLQISVETKINLMRLKKNAVVATAESQVKRANVAAKKSAVLYSDEEDSAESSTDEDCDEYENPEEPANAQPANSRGRKLMKLVDRITQSRYFQQATEYKYIKRAMEEVSNTRLLLNVEMKSCMGVLAVNIPPPPTDRVWYGFRGNPKLVLIAKPKVGEREVSFTYITEWLEKKMTLEFQRIFVMPNMDDIPIPLMCDQLDMSAPPPSPEPPVRKSTSSQEV